MQRIRTPWAIIAALLAMMFVLAACGETQDDQAGSGGAATTANDGATNAGGEIRRGLKFVSMPKQLGNPYEEVEHGGFADAVKELGGTHELVGPTDASASSQVPLINSVIQKRPDVLAIAGNDPNAVAPALRNAARRGISVVAFDSDVASDARKIFVNQASSEQIGRDQVKILAEQIDERGEIAILSATANATNQNTWIRFMREELKNYPNMKLVKVAYGDDDDQKSFQETQGLIQAYPNLKGIISPTTVGISAAARYLSKSDKKGDIALTGLGTPNQMRKFVKDGTVTEFALWNPADVGYLAAYASGALASNLITGAEGDKFKSGKLGEHTVGKNGEVILGPPTRFNRQNIDEFDF
ncbi:MAG TPA: rhamnose ABC transporter substrate-binding protein [Solirubrobacteraceae bacterium]|nr:rhamnose ABC transporter substrate-binding protein [Solirubrobacteraceae bacterium]